jgi:hypothetical protein
MNVAKYNSINRILLWIGTRILLRGMLARTVLETIKSELTRWKLIRDSVEN